MVFCSNDRAPFGRACIFLSTQRWHEPFASFLRSTPEKEMLPLNKHRLAPNRASRGNRSIRLNSIVPRICMWHLSLSQIATPAEDNEQILYFHPPSVCNQCYSLTIEILTLSPRHASHGTIVIGHFADWRTIWAASGSEKKLYSALAVALPTPANETTKSTYFPATSNGWANWTNRYNCRPSNILLLYFHEYHRVFWAPTPNWSTVQCKSKTLHVVSEKKRKSVVALKLINIGLDVCQLSTHESHGLTSITSLWMISIAFCDCTRALASTSLVYGSISMPPNPLLPLKCT